jgi:hypothetical protein
MEWYASTDDERQTAGEQVEQVDVGLDGGRSRFIISYEVVNASPKA